MDMMEERSSNHRPEVEGIDREDSDMGEDTAVVVEVVEREHKSVVLARHWTGDGAEMHRRTRREWKELVKSVCSEGHTTFVIRDSNCSSWRRL
jgi:hypothetical protein